MFIAQYKQTLMTHQTGLFVCESKSPYRSFILITFLWEVFNVQLVGEKLPKNSVYTVCYSQPIFCLAVKQILHQKF